MPTLNQLTTFLESFAPLKLAEEWDNVGLLVGDRKAAADRIMTCLTITGHTADEAVQKQADVIVSHHPLPFKPLKKITSDQTAGQILLRLIRHGIAVYSPHTAFDSAKEGINQMLADALTLSQVQPLNVAEEYPDGLGSGRFGRRAAAGPLSELVTELKHHLQIPEIRLVGDLDQSIRKVAIACGSGGSFLATARRQACDLLVTGEATFHTCLEAEAQGIAMLLVGHFASERFACEQLAGVLGSEFPQASVWASEEEKDPLLTV